MVALCCGYSETGAVLDGKGVEGSGANLHVTAVPQAYARQHVMPKVLWMP